MTPDQLTERMHAVLDGTATPVEAQALDAALAGNAEAAEEFASWKAMFATMHALPMAHPPEGLVAAVTARLPAAAREKSFSADGQLSAPDFVFASGQTRTTRFSTGLRTFFRRSTRSDSTEGHGHMNTNRKIWTGGAIAVVALGVVIFATGYPPKPADVTGTVVPAERYRAPQSGADAIKLGDQNAGKLVAAPTDAAGVQAAKTDAGLTADRALSEKASVERRAELATADKTSGLMADRALSEKASVDRRAELATADKTSGLMADRALAEKASVDRRAELATADKKAADKNAELANADRVAADKAADRALAAKAGADKVAEKALAEKLGADRKAERAMSDKAAVDRKAERATTN